MKHILPISGIEKKLKFVLLSHVSPLPDTQTKLRENTKTDKKRENVRAKGESYISSLAGWPRSRLERLGEPVTDAATEGGGLPVGRAGEEIESHSSAVSLAANEAVFLLQSRARSETDRTANRLRRLDSLTPEEQEGDRQQQHRHQSLLLHFLSCTIVSPLFRRLNKRPPDS